MGQYLTQLVLQLLGLLFVLLVLAGALSWFWFQRVLKRGLAQLQLDALVSISPSRIQLQPLQYPEWLEEAEMVAASATLEAAGFQSAGAFTAGMVEVMGFAHPEDTAYAMVVELADGSAAVDVVCEYPDGSWFTVSSTPEQGLDRPPKQPVLRLEGGAAEVLHTFCNQRPPGACLPADIAGFQNAVERYSEQEFEWRAARDGPTSQEILRIVESLDIEASDDVLEQARATFRDSVLSGWDEQLFDRFLQSTDLSAARWNEVQDRLLFVHDRLQASEVVERYQGLLGKDEATALRLLRELEARLGTETPRSAFQAINDWLPSSVRCTHLGQVPGPLAADAWCLAGE